MRNSSTGEILIIPFESHLIQQEKKSIQIRLRVIVSNAMEIVFKSDKILFAICLCGEIDQRYVTEDIFWEYPYLNIIRLGIKF